MTKSFPKRKIRRDEAIRASFSRELNLSTKVVRDRTKYSRKIKHLHKYIDAMCL